MNKALFQKVKDLTKDSGVSEKYLKSITEKMGGKIEDDSTDTEAIEECANLIAGVVADTQAEATRWAQKNKGGKKSKKSTKSEEDDEDEEDDEENEEEEDEDGKGKKKPKKSKSDDRLKALEEQLAELKAERAGSQRKSEIEQLMEKHKIPEHLRSRLAKSIADDEDAEDVISEYKQQLITNGLSDDNEGAKGGASAKDVDSAAEDNLKSIEVSN